MTDQEVVTTETKQLTLTERLDRMMPALTAQLDKSGMSAEAFARAVLTDIRKSTGLQRAAMDEQGQRSLWGAVLLAAQLRLEIGGELGHFYLTPRQIGKAENRHWECVPIIGYRGYLELARRTGKVEKAETFFIREGDLFEQWADSDKGKQYKWIPQTCPDDTDPKTHAERPWTHVIASVKVFGGGTIWEAITRAQVDARRPTYAGDKSPWTTHYDQMARKTAIRALAPYMPFSKELGVADQADGGTVEMVDDGELVVEVEGSGEKV